MCERTETDSNPTYQSGFSIHEAMLLIAIAVVLVIISIPFLNAKKVTAHMASTAEHGVNLYQLFLNNNGEFKGPESADSWFHSNEFLASALKDQPLPDDFFIWLAPSAQAAVTQLDELNQQKQQVNIWTMTLDIAPGQVSSPSVPVLITSNVEFEKQKLNAFTGLNLDVPPLRNNGLVAILYDGSRHMLKKKNATSEHFYDGASEKKVLYPADQ